MPGENVTTKFRVDITDLKRNIADATRQIKLAQAEFRNATAGTDDWANSADGLSAKITEQEKIVEAEKVKLQALKEQQERLTKAQEDGQKIIDDLTRKYEAAAAEYGEASDEAKAYAKMLGDAETAQRRNEAAAEDLNIRIVNQDTAVKNAEKSLGNYRAEHRKVQDAANSLTGKVKEQQSELDKLKERYIHTAAEQGQGCEEAQRLANEISTLSGELRQNQARLDSASDAADELDQSYQDTTDGGLSAFTIALGNLASNVISAAVSKMKELVSETLAVGAAFDSEMSKVAAISGASGEELQALRDKAKEMGATTQFSASEAASALEYMAMAGWKTDDMLNGISGIMDLAAASGEDLAATSDIVTDSLTAFGKSAEEAGRLADIMAAAASNSNTNVSMMGETFKYAASLAGSMGYSMEDTAIATGLMANSGIKATQAGTSLRSLLTRLSTQPKEAANAMAELGISIEDGHGGMKSMMEIMQELRGSFGSLRMEQKDFETQMNRLDEALESGELTEKEYNEQQEELIQKAYGAEGAMKAQYASMLAGKNGLSGFLAIVNASDDDFGKLTDAIYGSDGAAQDMAQTMNDNLSGDMKQFRSQLEGVQIMLYEKFEPALREGAQSLSGLIDAAKWMIDNLDTVAVLIGGVTTAIVAQKAANIALAVADKAAAAGTTVLGLAQMKLNAILSANPIGLIITGITLLIAALVYLYNHSEKFRNFVDGFFAELKKSWEALQELIIIGIDVIVQWFKNLVSDIGSGWETIKRWFSDGWQAVKDFGSAVRDGWSAIIAFFVNGWTSIKEKWAAAKQFFSDLWAAIKKVFTGIPEYFSGKFSDAWNGVKRAFSAVGEFFGGIWETIKSRFTDIGQKTADAIGGAFRSAINATLGVVEGAINKVPQAVNGALDKINALPGVSIPMMPEIRLPRLAGGGILTKPTVAQIGEAGDEAVIPLERNTRGLQRIAELLWAQMEKNFPKKPQFPQPVPQPAAQTSTTVNNYNTNFTQNNTSPKALSRLEIYRQTKNLIALLKGAT